MIDLIIAMVQAFLSELQMRKLAKRIKLADYNSKDILRALRLADTQAKCRQVYGLLENGQCVVDFKDNGDIVITKKERKDSTPPEKPTPIANMIRFEDMEKGNINQNERVEHG